MQDWRDALGESAARSDEAAIAPFARTLFRSAPRPAGVVRVHSRDEVVAAVEVANRRRVPLYPVSRGRNWGFGDASPMREEQVILDMSGMDRVISVDPDLAYAVVEPGVSQAKLAACLRETAPRLWMPCTASTPDASVLANAVERGWGHTPYGDHFAHVAGMEVVLGDGSVIGTGFGQSAPSSTTYLSKGGPGPSLEGLFSQSNMGIVTRVGVWLMPEPEHFRAFFFTLNEGGSLEEVIERLRPLRLTGVLQNPVHVYNDVRAASFVESPSPVEQAAGALGPDARRKLRERHAVGPWNATGAFYGSRAVVWANSRTLKRELSGLGSLRFVTPQLLARVERVARPLARLGIGAARTVAEQISRAQAPLDYLRGIPNDYAMAGCRWRVRELTDPGALDPFANSCGIYWVVPTCPARGSDAQRLVDIVESVCHRHGLDALISITLLNGRMLILPVHIAFDRDDADEAARAEACHHELLDAVIAAGYPPWRVGNAGMPALAHTGSWEAVARIKKALDPRGVLAPGRYGTEPPAEPDAAVN